MRGCNGCIHRNTYTCMGCVGWNRYESNTLINQDLAMDISREMMMLAEFSSNNIFEERKIDMKIEKVIFNAPATVVIWKDGSKTIVKSGDYDVYDPEKGLAMAIAKKALGNKGNYYEVFKKWVPDEGFKYLCNRIKLNQAIDECFGCPEDTVGIAITSDDNETKEVKPTSEKGSTINSVTLREYCVMNNYTKNKVYGMIKRNEVDAYKDDRGYWRINISK